MRPRLIEILASNKGLDIVDAVITALNNATFDKQSAQKVLIQSDDSSVLLKFKDFNNAVLDYPFPVYMSQNYSNLVQVMHAANISVYVGVLRNEFQNFLFDYYADPYVELATLTQNGVDGVVTDYPATSLAYMNSPCANPKANLPYTILPIMPGDMFMNAVAAKPPQGAPIVPPIETKDVVDPPLPPVAKIPDSAPNSSSPAASDSTPAHPAEAPKSSEAEGPKRRIYRGRLIIGEEAFCEIISRDKTRRRAIVLTTPNLSGLNTA